MLINAAKASAEPVTDHRLKLLVVTPVAVLGLLLGLFVMLELKVGRITDLDDLSRQLPVEVFAVPPLPGRETIDFEDQIEEALAEDAARIAGRMGRP